MTSSAFEKLLQIQAEKNTRQCQCGSHIEGECPECDESNDLIETSLQNEPEKGVNPPEKKKEQCPTCHKWFVRLKRHRCEQSSAMIESEQENDQASREIEPKSSNDQSPCQKESDKENDQSESPKEPHVQNDQTQTRIEPKAQNDQKHPCMNLYVHILMEKGSMNAIPLDEFLKPVTDAICKENDVDHWRNLPFGKAKGTLAVRTERFLRLQKDDVNIYVAPYSLEWEAVADVLRRYATNVFVGVR